MNETAKETGKAGVLAITSPAFQHGQAIPKKYTGDGQDVSPPLVIANVPSDTAAMALICDDPDAPTPQPWVHWVVYNIPPDTRALGEGTTPNGASEGRNSWGAIGYRGPAPPRGHGVHHYHFKLYALSEPVDLADGADKQKLLEAMDGKIIARAELIGTYQR